MLFSSEGETDDVLLRDDCSYVEKDPKSSEFEMMFNISYNFSKKPSTLKGMVVTA